MKIIYSISFVYFVIVLHTVSEGKNLPESQEITGKLPDILFGALSDKPGNDYCECKNKECQCCYDILNVSVCTSSRVIQLINEEKDLAIQGTLIINNGPVFTGSIKFKNIPKMCYRNDRFGVCLSLRYDVVANDQLKLCGKMYTSYFSTSMQMDLFCKTFEIIRKEDYYSVNETENIENGLIPPIGFEPNMFQKIDHNIG